MKCPSCGYLSLEEARLCKKCGAELRPGEGRELNFTFGEDGFSWESLTPQRGQGEADTGLRDSGWRLEEASRAAEQTEPKQDRQAQPPKPGVRPARVRPAAVPPPPAPPRQDAPPPPAPAEAPRPEPLTFNPERLLDAGRPQAEPPAPAAPTPPPAAGEPVPASPPQPREPVRADQPTPAAPPEPAAEADTESSGLVFDDFAVDLLEETPPPEQAGAAAEAAEEEDAREAAAAAEPLLPLENPEELPAVFWGEARAGIARRAGAFLLDQGLVAVLLIGFVAAAGLGLHLQGASLEWLAGNLWMRDAWLPFLLLWALLGAVYHVALPWAVGRTPGKSLFAISVVTLDGERLKPWLAMMRWMAYLPSAIPFGLGFAWAVLDADKRAWHDYLCGTMVVEEGQESA